MKNCLDYHQYYNNKKLAIFILGPTCVGKTNVAIFLAKKLNTEIISIDSRQFYKELKIGTDAPSLKDRNNIPHHFIGHISIHQNYNAKLFEKQSLKKIDQLFNKYPILIMVGGSSLYEKAITDGLSDIPDIDQNVQKKIMSIFNKYGIQSLQNEFIRITKNNSFEKKKIDFFNPRRLIRYIEIFQSTGHPPSFFLKRKKKEIFQY